MSLPSQNVFERQRPSCCPSCRLTNGRKCEETCDGPHYKGSYTSDPGTNSTLPTGTSPAQGTITSLVPAQSHGNDGATKTMGKSSISPHGPAHPMSPPAWFAAIVSQLSENYCEPIGAPYPCRPYMDPSNPDRCWGSQIPCDTLKCEYEEAVKRLCWVETTLRSLVPVPAGEDIEFSLEVKWWFQIQKMLNVGDQVNTTFEMVNIAYGQSNYSLEIREYLINDVPVPQNGTDIRIWNFEMFDKFYPFPASALNDPVAIRFRNVSAGEEDIALVAGGPGVLQIG